MGLNFSIDDTPSTYGSHELASYHITSNLTPIAREIGVYYCLWEPEKHGFLTALSITNVLEKGIAFMKENANLMKKLEPANGWGTYDTFLECLENLLEDCKKYPAGVLRSSR